MPLCYIVIIAPIAIYLLLFNVLKWLLSAIIFRGSTLIDAAHGFSTEEQSEINMIDYCKGTYIYIICIAYMYKAESRTNILIISAAAYRHNSTMKEALLPYTNLLY